MTDHSNHLQSAVLEAFHSKSSLQIIGGNSKAFYGRKIHADQTLDVSANQGIVSYDPAELAITVRAGTPLKTLEQTLLEYQQELPFEPPDFCGKSTIGGTVAAGLSGPRRPWAGAIRDAMLGVTIINGCGQILEFGGQVMKNVAGYDVSRLLAGSLGTLGVLLEISLKVQPRARHEITLVQASDFSSAHSHQAQWRQHIKNITAAAFDGEMLFLRLRSEQPEPDKLNLIHADILENARGFWLDVKNHQHAFFQNDAPLWRISVPPATSKLPLPGDTFTEWDGGLRWLKTEATANDIWQVASQYGGHATLFRRIEPSPTEIFQPISDGLMALQRRLKQAFDPKRIFNPEKIYPNV
jgi:glycolate oxidase FAD binding subunit